MNKSFYDLMPKSITVRDNVSLRLLVPGDAEHILEIFQADPDIQNRVTWTSGLKTIEAIEDKIHQLIGNNEALYVVIYDDDIVGYVGVWGDDGWFGVTHQDDYAYGYFCHPSYRGKGIIADSVKALMVNVESVVHVKTFSIYTEDSNLASQAIAKKLGLVPTDEVYIEPVLGSTERRYIRTVTPTQ